MNIWLTPELEKFINDQVESGQFSTASEVVWHALTLFEQSQTTRATQLEEFNRELAARIASLDRGEFVTAEESRRHFEEKSSKRRAEIAAAHRSCP